MRVLYTGAMGVISMQTTPQNPTCPWCTTSVAAVS